MPTASRARSAAHARFVFIGTVQKLRAATMDDVPIDERTAIVRVDEVILAPEALAHYAGHDITVHVGGRKRLQAGQQARFSTNPWLFGDSIAVESIDQEDVRRTAVRDLNEGSHPIRQLADRDVQSRFADADLVVSGRVASVRVPSDVIATRSARARGAPAPVPRISEHDPDWRIADIQVDEVHKGTLPQDTVSVRFPASTDVMWHDAPKFQAGQEGFFLLHRPSDGASKASREREAALKDTGDYVVLRPTDFQPLAEAAGVRRAIDALALRSATRPSEEPRQAAVKQSSKRPRPRARTRSAKRRR
jgi:hypothetical protein